MSQKLPIQLEELAGYLPKRMEINTSISEKNIAWHLEHMILVADAILQTVLDSNPTDYKWKLNPLRSLIMKSGIIPRGQGKAPRAVRPKEEKEIEVEVIMQQIEAVNTKLTQVVAADPNAHFNHPYFGLMKRDEAIAFTQIHTEHHLKIVRDILKKI